MCRTESVVADSYHYTSSEIAHKRTKLLTHRSEGLTHPKGNRIEVRDEVASWRVKLNEHGKKAVRSITEMTINLPFLRANP